MEREEIIKQLDDLKLIDLNSYNTHISAQHGLWTDFVSGKKLGIFRVLERFHPYTMAQITRMTVVGKNSRLNVRQNTDRKLKLKNWPILNIVDDYADSWYLYRIGFHFIIFFYRRKSAERLWPMT